MRKDASDPNRYVGKVCAKHPHLGGLRTKLNRSCTGCRVDAARVSKQGGIARARTARRNQAVQKEAVFTHYGKQCKLCGFDDMRALTIDHIDQNGANHRSSNGKRMASYLLYSWLRRNGFPTGFRTLCCNCQSITWREHQESIRVKRATPSARELKE